MRGFGVTKANGQEANMSWLRGRFESILDSIFAYVVLTFVLPPVIGGIIYLATQRLEYLIYGAIGVLVLTNTVLLVYLLQSQRRALKDRSSVAVFKDPHDMTYYLVDIFGRAKEFPDEDTFYYVCDLFGLDPEVPQKSRRDFKRAIMTKLPNRVTWIPPHALEKSGEKELQWRLKEMVEIANKDVNAYSEPQAIQITLENISEEIIYIKQVALYPRELLSEHDFDKRHRREDGTYVLHFSDGEERYTLDVGKSGHVYIYLAKKWSYEDLDGIKRKLINAEFGTLHVYVEYKGEVVRIPFSA